MTFWFQGGGATFRSAASESRHRRRAQLKLFEIPRCVQVARQHLFSAKQWQPGPDPWPSKDAQQFIMSAVCSDSPDAAAHAKHSGSLEPMEPVLGICVWGDMKRNTDGITGSMLLALCTLALPATLTPTFSPDDS